jgi:diguanylate cyclase (GGDEF)-like protein
MNPPINPSSPEYRSPRWVQALGDLIERFGVARAIFGCTLLCVAFSLLITLSISLILIPESMWPSLLIGATVPLFITPSISFLVFRLIADLNLTRRALRQIANQDGLTQANTRRFFMAAVTAPLPASPGRSACDSIVLLDVDDFKKINDLHGHLFGDTVLRAVSDACRLQLRTADLFARFGGEEFVILLADTSPDLARAVAERIRRAIADLDIRNPDGVRVPVTVSLGIAHRADRFRGAGAALLEQALGMADQALYVAKRNGKNRSEFVNFTEPVPAPA